MTNKLDNTLSDITVTMYGLIIGIFHSQMDTEVRNIIFAKNEKLVITPIGVHFGNKLWDEIEMSWNHQNG